MGDGDALGLAGGAGGEDDPRVLLDTGPGGRNVTVPEDGQRVLGADDGPYVGLAEDQLGPLVRVLGVHGDVGGTGGEYGEDRDVEVVGPGRDAHADPVTEADTGRGQGAAQGLHLDGQRTVGEADGAVVQGELVGIRPHRRVENVDKGAGRGGLAAAEKRAVSPNCVRISSSSPRALLSCMAAIGPRVSNPETSGVLAGPQVCLGLSSSSSVP